MSGASEGAGGSFGPGSHSSASIPTVFRTRPNHVNDKSRSFLPAISALSSSNRKAQQQQRPIANAGVEEPLPSVGTANGPRRQRIGSQYVSLCPKVDCSFDRKPKISLLCQYKSGNLDGQLILETNANVRDWIMSEHRIANSLTGIVDDFSGQGMYLFAGETDRRSDTFVLSTEEFTVDEECRLDFFIHMAGTQGRMRVCVDSLDNCPFERSGAQLTSDARQWNNAFVALHPGKHTVHFIADHLRKNYVIGLDQIQLLNQYGTAAVACA